MTKHKNHNRYSPLPTRFATKLRKEWPASTVNGLLRAARDAGWTTRALGEVVGVTPEAIRQRSLMAHPSYAAKRAKEVPVAPIPERKHRKVRGPRDYKPREVPADVAAELARLTIIARTVNGATLSDDPRRAASVTVTAMMFDLLVNQGYSSGAVGRAAGVSRSAVYMRLGRHGYLEPFPSQADSIYVGRATHEEI